MKITTEVFDKGSDYTISKLYVDGIYCCYIMEDVIREGEKVYAKTAIPRGTYNVVVNMSPHFKKLLPNIQDVPGFDRILIHSGNTSEDTKGCLLTGFRIGMLDGRRAVLDSRPAFSKLFAMIQEAIARNEKVTIELK